jgi:acetylglutamate kinase
MIASGTIGEGMIPKVECCLNALGAGVARAHVIDGRIAHGLLQAVFSDEGVGTEVIQHATRPSVRGKPAAA